MSNKESKIINFDDYEACEEIYYGPFDVEWAVNKKTGKEIAIQIFDDDSQKSLGISSDIDECQSFINNMIKQNFCDSPGVAKLIGYYLPLVNENDLASPCIQIDQNAEIFSSVSEQDFVIIYESGKNEKYNVSELTKDYLQSNGVKNQMMNPTIRSKIIFGIAAILKHICKNNLNPPPVKLEFILLDDKLDPKLGNFYTANILDKSYRTRPSLSVWTYPPPIEIPPEFLDDNNHSRFSQENLVYSYGTLIYSLFALKPTIKNQSFSNFHLVKSILSGKRLDKPEMIPDCYWEIVENCWKTDPKERPTFDKIVDILKDDKYAINEFGMKTDLDKLHEYRERIILLTQ